MSERSVVIHALTEYFDGDGDLANKVLDAYLYRLAEDLRDIIRRKDYPLEVERVSLFVAGWRSAADQIDPRFGIVN